MILLIIFYFLDENFFIGQGVGKITAIFKQFRFIYKVPGLFFLVLQVVLKHSAIL